MTCKKRPVEDRRFKNCERCRIARRAYNKKDREQNPDVHRARRRAWVKQNPEKRAAILRRSRKPEKMRMYVATRRARKKGAFVEAVDPLEVLIRSQGRCGICLEPVDPDNFHVDHIKPLAVGGEHSYANTQAAHPSCNDSKGAREAAD